MRGDLNQPAPQQQQQQQPEVYDDDFETQYRQQAASSGFRGHSPIREVKFIGKILKILLGVEKFNLTTYIRLIGLFIHLILFL